ncbi:hypothetical protein KY290_017225 [Solanum tuberosum]|uniref:NB-ARC domain-containing protein n=1 Tax=Solanum tuberosum TaxID=4113 RepID=A0ABQ7VCZ8_SOLTU|nr:hypothetical protein KY284_016253 [Solanum tuberosum]KAH0701983.1 hypothetical protein KY285_016261 [Solanum tuberosum]KAH0761152.1 hypothetical protein KY290_017225 [Solanum tuberosum]
MTTEEKMFEYLFRHLHDLPKYCSDFLLPQMIDYKILRQVFRHLRDFYSILVENKTSTEYLYPRFQLTADRVTQFCFNLWTGQYRGDDGDYKEYDVSHCSSKITSLLINLIPLELDVLYICISKLMKESRSTELEGFVKKILKASPRILQLHLIHLQRRMEAHVGLLTRKISILVGKLLEESFENNINEADFSAPDLLQEIEQMKGDIRHIFLKAPESSQLGFPMDDGLLFMNLLLGCLYDLLISNVYSVSLIKKEIGMVKESFEFLRSSFGKVRKTLDDTSGVVNDCWVRTLDMAYETEHVISSILVRDKALSHLIFSLPSVANKIKLIVAEVTSLQLEDKNGNDPLDAKSSDKPIESTSSSFVEVTVGHEEEESQIIDQLLAEHESELEVISIVGMPGLVTGSERNKSEDDLAEKLRRALLDKRYLIILDDVWDIATVEMVFGEGRCPAELSYVGHQIVEKCKGLPLAVVLIAGVTVRVRKGKKKENEKDLCLKIQHNLDSFISANNNLQMMKVMQLSFDHLPYHLKSLLLYCARSQKSKRTPVSKLMQLWMAEGFVDHDIPSKSSLEEATQSYLDALISVA